jgi:putative restriction endonuclease
MTRTELQKRVGTLRTARLEDASARHKPMLLLYAIGRLTRGEPRDVTLCEIEKDLGLLLSSQLGVGHKTEATFPFWHLQRDALWEVRGAENLRWRADRKRPLTSELRRSHVLGRLPDEVADQLSNDADLRRVLIRGLLRAYWGERDIPKVVKALRLARPRATGSG